MIHNGRLPGQVKPKPGEVCLLSEANSPVPTTVVAWNQQSHKKYHHHSKTIRPESRRVDFSRTVLEPEQGHPICDVDTSQLFPSRNSEAADVDFRQPLPRPCPAARVPIRLTIAVHRASVRPMSHTRIKSPDGMARLERLRAICLPLLETVEAVDKFGHTSFRYRDKPYVIAGEGSGTPGISIKADRATQMLLLDREGFTRTPYIGQHGWVSVDYQGPVPWNQIERLIREGYKMVVAPQRKAVAKKSLRQSVIGLQIGSMKNEYTAVVKQADDWWIGWIEEIPGVNCQEKSYEELKATLEITLKEALEFNRHDALVAAGSDYREEKIAI